MSNIIIYQKPTCSTCRQAVQILKESGKPFTAINYYDQPFTKSGLKNLLKKARLSARDVLRTKEERYKKLRLGKKEVSDEELFDLMLQHPDLIQRPLVQKGDRAMLARPAETIKKFL